MSAILDANEYSILEYSIYVYKRKIDALILLIIDRSNQLRAILNKLTSITTDFIAAIADISIFVDIKDELLSKIDNINNTALFDEKQLWKNIRSSITLSVNSIYIYLPENAISLISASILLVKTIKTRFAHLHEEDINKIYKSYTSYKHLNLIKKKFKN